MSKAILVAELGWNWVGDISLAKLMIEFAKDSGADYAKFQTWKAERLVPGPWDEDGRRELYEEAELTIEKHGIMKEYCESLGIGFMTSCFCHKDIDTILQFSNKIKIPGADSACERLVSECIEKFEHVYLSTGSLNEEEIVRWAHYDNVTLMHCVSSYPCKLENINLPKMAFLKTLTPRVGYSGHALGPYDAIAAICMGATIVEKHFTIDNNLPAKDNKMSILPRDMKLIKDFRDAHEEMSIDNGLDIQECEKWFRQYHTGRFCS
jgi:N,N'-diacetyllegionaminate synthase